MTSQHRTDRLRVAPPTLEPDPVFLAMLADLSASSRAAGSRAARPAGLRMIVATASVAVIATATWAGGIGVGTPLSPAEAPTQLEPSGPPSHGDVATPQRDVSISPGSPVSPGLPGTPSAVPDRTSGSGVDIAGARNAKAGGRHVAQGKQGIPLGDSNRKSRDKDKSKSQGNPRQANRHSAPARK